MEQNIFFPIVLSFLGSLVSKSVFYSYLQYSNQHDLETDDKILYLSIALYLLGWFGMLRVLPYSLSPISIIGIILIVGVDIYKLVQSKNEQDKRVIYDLIYAVGLFTFTYSFVFNAQSRLILGSMALIQILNQVFLIEWQRDQDISDGFAYGISVLYDIFLAYFITIYQN